MRCRVLWWKTEQGELGQSVEGRHPWERDWGEPPWGGSCVCMLVPLHHHHQGWHTHRPGNIWASPMLVLTSEQGEKRGAQALKEQGHKCLHVCDLHKDTGHHNVQFPHLHKGYNARLSISCGCCGKKNIHSNYRWMLTMIRICQGIDRSCPNVSKITFHQQNSFYCILYHKPPFTFNMHRYSNLFQSKA